MTTKNFRDLSQRVPIASAKRGNCVTLYNRRGYRTIVHNIQSKEFETLRFEDAEFTDFKDLLLLLVRREYDWRINLTSSYISDIFAKIYERPVRFADKVSDLIIKIKNFMEKTGKTIQEVVDDIRVYLGYKCLLFRSSKGSMIPITHDRIEKAFNLVSRKASIIQVENALYF